MADFDPLTIPAVMPGTVRRTKEKMVNGKLVSGFPTEHALNYEGQSQAWMKANVANTNTRLNLISDEVDGAYAAITTEATTRASADEALATEITTLEATVGSNTAAIAAEATARSTADSALASSITVVDAKANSATASGQVYLTAMAGPGGAAAAYGWHLTTSGAYAGMQALALSGGGSAIGFTANKFMFTDSGTAQAVMDYNGSAFVFQVPIVIRSAASGERLEMTNSKIEIFDSTRIRVALGIGI